MVTLPVNKIFCALQLYHNLNSCQLNEIAYTTCVRGIQEFTNFSIQNK